MGEDEAVSHIEMGCDGILKERTRCGNRTADTRRDRGQRGHRAREGRTLGFGTLGGSGIALNVPTGEKGETAASAMPHTGWGGPGEDHTPAVAGRPGDRQKEKEG